MTSGTNIDDRFGVGSVAGNVTPESLALPSASVYIRGTYTGTASEISVVVGTDAVARGFGWGIVVRSLVKSFTCRKVVVDVVCLSFVVCS